MPGEQWPHDTTVRLNKSRKARNEEVVTPFFDVKLKSAERDPRPQRLR